MALTPAERRRQHAAAVIAASRQGGAAGARTRADLLRSQDARPLHPAPDATIPAHMMGHPRAALHQAMGAWHDPNASTTTNAQHFAQARLGLLQEAMRRMAAAYHPGGMPSPMADIGANLQNSWQQAQQYQGNPEAQWRYMSGQMAALAPIGQTDPRNLLMQMLGGHLG